MAGTSPAKTENGAGQAREGRSWCEELCPSHNVAYSAGCAALTVCSDKILQVMWTGARYTIIPNLDVIGAYYHYNQNTFTNASCASLGSHSQCAGTFDAVSAVLDWQFANKFDVMSASCSRR